MSKLNNLFRNSWIFLSAALLMLPALGYTTPLPTGSQKGALASPVSKASLIGRSPATQTVSASIVLPLRNQGELRSLLHSLYTKGDPLYRHYLKPGEFTARFGPAKTDVDAVVAYARSVGLTVTEVTPNNVIVKVQASTTTMENAFGVHLNDYRAADGSTFRSPDRHWTMPAAVSSRVLDVLGLDTSLRGHKDLQRAPDRTVVGGAPQDNEDGVPGLSPYDFSQVYNLSGYYGSSLPSIPVYGYGQTYALFEMGGWTPSDITNYENLYDIQQLAPTFKAVDGGSSSPNGDSDETTLDIDMILATAPEASNINVYVADGGGTYNSYLQASVDIFNQIATDDSAQVVSVSFGIPENDVVTVGDENYLISEYDALSQMASQGQTVCVASGDAAAFADQNLTDSSGNPLPNIDDPGAQPLVLCVGGTDFDYDPTSSLTYPGETSWFDPNDTGRGKIGTGGGGGFSSVWGEPDYQDSAFTASSDPQASTTYRNTPDVSLYGDYDSAPSYSIYYTPPGGSGGWAAYNGTSAASPLWAGFLGLVNADLANHGGGTIGQANQAIYTDAENSTNYSNDFHDINDYSNNGYFYAYPGYDNSTGWGSFNGYNLLSSLGGAWLAGLSFSPSSVYPYVYTTLTGTLSGPAPSGGITIPVSYAGSEFNDLSFAAGQTTASFSVYAGTPSTYGPFSANYGGTYFDAYFTCIAPTLSTFTTSSNSASGGAISGTVTLTGNAPYGRRHRDSLEQQLLARQCSVVGGYRGRIDIRQLCNRDRLGDHAHQRDHHRVLRQCHRDSGDSGRSGPTEVDPQHLVRDWRYIAVRAADHLSRCADRRHQGHSLVQQLVG